jgi:phage-related protein
MPAGNNIGSVSIKVTPDTTGFREKVLAALAGADDDIRVKLDLDENGIRQKVRAATSGLDEKVKVKVDVDRGPLDRLGGLFNKAPSGGGGGGFGLLGPFVDNLAVVAAVAAIAAPALALVTGALATLPAVIAGVATPIGVIALGMDGIKKAAEQLGPPLDSLKKSISGVFETRLTPVFAQLAGVMPKLEGPLKAVANSISDVAASFIDTISTGPGLANIQGTIRNIASTISTMAPGVSSLTSGLLGLANNVSARFPQVGQWFDNAAQGFANWVDKAAADGSLDRAMGNLGTTLKGVLDIVGDIAKQGFDWLQDPKFGAAMKTFVSDLQSLVNTTLPALGSFFTDLTATIDQLGGALSKANNLPEWLKPDSQPDRANPKRKDGTPGDTSNFFEPFTSKDAPWRTMLDEFKSSFTSSMLVVEGIAQTAWLTIQQQAVAAFSTIGATIGTALSGAFTNLQTVAAAAWNGLVTTATTVVSQVVATFSQIPSRLAGVFGQLAGAAQAGFSGLVGAAASAMGSVVSTVGSAVGQVISQIASIPGKAAGALAGLAGVGAAAGASLVKGLVSGILGGIGAVVAAAAKLAAAVASHMPHSPAETGPLSGKGWTLYSGQAIGQGLADGMLNQLSTVTNAAQQLAQAIKDQLDSGAVVDPRLQEQIKPTLDALELQRKQLKVDKDAIPKGKETKDQRDALQGQMDQITALKDQLGLQKDQLGFAGKYGSELDEHSKSVDQANNIITDSIAKMIDGVKGFAMANVNQFASDLGISGNGAIPTIANTGVDFLSSTLSGLASMPFGGGKGGGTTIQVNSVDEALAAKQTLDNKKALQFAGR